MKTNNHEVIFAIVNAGFAEDVMEVAKEQGARGGTILNALYKHMGMGKKAQGIVFSLPVSDEAGLVQIPEEAEAGNKQKSTADWRCFLCDTGL